MNKTKKASVKPVKTIAHISHCRLRADTESLKPRLIRAFDLREWGFLLDASSKVSGGNYDIWRVLDADTKRAVDFTFLAMKGQIFGACLPHSYSYYVEDGEKVTVHGVNRIIREASLAVAE